MAVFKPFDEPFPQFNSPTYGDLMFDKTWSVLPAPPADFAGSIGMPELHARLLYNRGIQKAEDIAAYLAGDCQLHHDPMLLPDMAEAVARIKLAIDRNETVGVYGDFDADGITGTAALTLALREVGLEVVPYLPDRKDEGHGLNRQALEHLRGRGVSLLITVDCGANDVDEIGAASSLQIDTIVTDHHTIKSDLPEACAVINPQRSDSSYPYPHLTGVGMSFKLCEALYSALGMPWPEHLLELVALGTVADVGPLTGENRFFVKSGLERLNSSRNPGIQALVSRASLKLGSLTTESLSFGLIPRINVAGRLGDPYVSLQLLTTSSPAEAVALAEVLEQKNHERQALTSKGVRVALTQVPSMLSDVPAIIFVGSRDWNPGILGLIASRLVDQYYRPVVAVGVGDDVSRASARSIPEFDIVGALHNSGELFLRFGGHPQAAGFTIPTASLAPLKRRLEIEAASALQGKDLAPSIQIDCEAEISQVVGAFSFIQSLSPFGERNPAPVFLSRGAKVVEARQVGGQRTHLKLTVSQGGAVLDAIAFGHGSRLSEARNAIDIVYSVGLDTWGARPKMQLTVSDFRQSH